MSAVYIILPGWGGSGPAHWQSRWASELPGATRVEVDDWFRPTREDWIGSIDRVIAAAPTPPYVVAHSLGCVALAYWAQSATRPLGGALLVAPPDLDDPKASAHLKVFAPLPRARLPFPSHVVASDNDPYATVACARALAASWGSELTVVRRAGHINAASELGDWARGRAVLQRLVDSTPPVAASA